MSAASSSNAADSARQEDSAASSFIPVLTQPKAADLNAQLKLLSTSSAAELRQEWTRLFRAPPPARLLRDLLMLGVGWKLQTEAHGGLSGPLKRRLGDLARALEADGNLASARIVALRPGAKLVRAWGGRTHEVLVTEHGFVWNGRAWRSLSHIAREITGARWSGPRFFGLKQTMRASAASRSKAEAHARDAADA